MKNLSVQKMGGTGALLVAFCTPVFVLAVLLASEDAMGTGLPSLPHVLSDYALALLGLFGLAVVPAVSALVMHLSEGWVRWTSTIAALGFALLAVTSFWQADYESSVIKESQSVPAFLYEDGSAEVAEATQETGETEETPEAPSSPYTLMWEQLMMRAPQGWLEVAGVGLWILSVSWLARGGSLLPSGVVWIGLLAGLLSISTAVGATFDVALLKVCGIVGGGFVLTPLWFGRVGFVLLHVDAPLPRLVVAVRGKKSNRAAVPAYLNHNPVFKRIWGLYSDGS